MTISYSVQLIVNREPPGVKIFENDPLFPSKQKPQINDDKLNDCIVSIRETMSDLSTATIVVQKALDAYQTACEARKQFEIKLTIEISEYNEFLWNHLLFLVHPPGSVESMAQTILPTRLRSPQILALSAQNGRSGADFAAYCLTLLQESTLNIHDQTQRIIKTQSVIASSPRNERASAAHNEELQQLDSKTKKYGFSAEGIMIPAGSDFRLPVTVSVVSLLSKISL